MVEGRAEGPPICITSGRRETAHAGHEGVDETVTLARRARQDEFAMRFLGGIDLPVAGLWGFEALSDDGVELLVDGLVVLSDDSIHAARTTSGTVLVSEPGLHALEVRYFDRSGGETLVVSFQAPGAPAFVEIPATSLRTFAVR